MSTLTIPNTFSPLTTAQSAQVNANFSAVATAVNNIDNTNIGALGVYASQVIPTSTAQATFGGSFGYTFYPNSTGQVPLTVSGTTNQTGHLLDLTTTSGGLKGSYFDKTASLNTTGLATPSAPTLSQTAGGSLGSRTGYVKITYAGPGGAESAPSSEASFAISANNLLVVSSPSAIAGALGYYVYANTSSGAEVMQNTSGGTGGTAPQYIAFGTNWTEPTGGMTTNSLFAHPPASNLTGSVVAGTVNAAQFIAGTRGTAIGGPQAGGLTLAAGHSWSTALYTDDSGAGNVNGVGADIFGIGRTNALTDLAYDGSTWSFANAVKAGSAITAGTSIAAGSSTGATLTAGDLGASRSTSTGALTLGGSSSSGTLDYGVSAASVFTLSKPLAGLAMTNAGASLGTTSHIVQGVVSATGASTTVTWSGAAVFATNTGYTVVVFDLTSGAYVAISGQTTTSISFSSTNGHTYQYLAVGA